MKNYVKLLVCIAFVMVIGFPAAAQVRGNSALNGTWVNSEGEIKYVMNNGNWTMSGAKGAVMIEAVKGTYNVNGNDITMTITQVSGAIFEEAAGMMGVSPSQWYTDPQLKAAMTQAGMEFMYTLSGLAGIFTSYSGPYALRGNNLTLPMESGPMVFTKQ